MIDMRYKPRFLPQMNAPYDVVLEKLDEEGVGYEVVEVDPNELEPLQGITFSDEVGKVNGDDMNPIWISENNKVLDGHHRMVRGLLDNNKIKAIRVGLNEKDCCRVLNKIQDIYEYEESQGLEEVELQDTINFYRDDENQFLNTLEEDNAMVQEEKSSANQQTIVGYRKEPIRDNSVVGNFFTLKPIDGYDKYQIEFENLLDTHALGVMYKDGQQPVEILAKIWFPHVNFEEISKQYNMPSINLKNKAIAEKAQKMGFDGIKYGDTLIQGLK